MKLHPALMMASGPPGVWLIDEANQTRFTISIAAADGSPPNKLALQTIAAAIAEAFNDDGLEVPG
jgi:flagellar biosynthesis/type III secretory pathway ATPase